MSASVVREERQGAMHRLITELRICDLGYLFPAPADSWVDGTEIEEVSSSMESTTNRLLQALT